MKNAVVLPWTQVLPSPGAKELFESFLNVKEIKASCSASDWSGNKASGLEPDLKWSSWKLFRENQQTKDKKHEESAVRIMVEVRHSGKGKQHISEKTYQGLPQHSCDR